VIGRFGPNRRRWPEWATAKRTRSIRAETGSRSQRRTSGAPCAPPSVLVVTKMWPTASGSFRNGFLQLQVESVRKLGTRCEVFVTQEQGAGVLGYLRTALAIRRAVSSGQYDVVHAHYGLTGVSCLLQRQPLIVTLHGSDIYGSVDIDGRKTLKGYIEWLASRLAARRADVVIAVSARMAALIPWAKPVVVPVGIDTELFQSMDRAEARSQLGLDPRAHYILFAASVDNPVKRYGLAQETIAIVKRRLPDVELVAVSGEHLERMPIWMSAADALLITSLYEGGPMIHREAMACNLPVVSVDVGDVALHVSGVAQSQVVGADASLLADALEAVINSGCRSDGRARAQVLDIAATANAINEIYAQLADKATTKDRVATEVA
jgi:teichuronic acid biosynthesis glycosyltransferase TuaC